jgi:mRNA interferase RelE/StbE
MPVKYEIRFHPAALKEYEKLDHSIAGMVDKKLKDLEERAAEIGKPLSGNLAGYREIKLRDAGIRIIYEIIEDEILILDIVYILAIQKREGEQVFKTAIQRKSN